METINADSTRLIKSALFFTVTAISVALTCVFFVSHFRFQDLYQVSPLANYILVTIIGLTAADVGALAWRHISVHHCETARQVNLSHIMIGLTLLVTTLTTFGGLADAITAGSMIPVELNGYINWIILSVVALEFIVGSFFFDLSGAELSIQREVIGVITTEANEVINSIRASLGESRADRVQALSDSAAQRADLSIRQVLGRNTVHIPALPSPHHPAEPPTIQFAAASPALPPRLEPRPVPGFNAAPDDADCNLIAWSDTAMPVVIDVGAQSVLAAEIGRRRQENPALHYAVVRAADLAHLSGDPLPDFFGRSQ